MEVNDVPVSQHPSDAQDIRFTDSSGLTSTYHRWASSVDLASNPGLLVYLHGDGAYGYDNPDVEYDLGGPGGIRDQARVRNMICVAPLSPNLKGRKDRAWWRKGTRKAAWLAELIERLTVEYPAIDTDKVWLTGFSGGAQQITQYFMPLHSDRLTDGGAVIFGGGGAGDDFVTPQPYAAALRATFPMHWYTGGDDDGTNGGDGYDGGADATAGEAYYSDEGFTTSIERPAGVPHDMGGHYGPIVGRKLSADYDAPVLTPGAKITRDTHRSSTFTGNVQHAGQVTVRWSSSPISGQTGWLSYETPDDNGDITAAVNSLTRGTDYYWQVEVESIYDATNGDYTDYGTVLASGTLSATVGTTVSTDPRSAPSSAQPGGRPSTRESSSLSSRFSRFWRRAPR